MHTQCQHCQTIFNVTADQLRSAHGLVRCGHCMSTFDGLLGLSEEAALALDKATRAEESAGGEELHHEHPTVQTVLTNQWTVALADTPPVQPAGQTDSTDSLVEPASASPPAVSSEVSAANKSFETPETFDYVGAEQFTDELIEQAGSIVPSLPRDASAQVIAGEPIDMETLRSLEAQVDASLQADFPADDAETDLVFDEVLGDDLANVTGATDTGYPQVLVDDVARLQRVAAGSKVRKVWAVSSICLLVVLVFQYAWFMPEDMAMRYPQTRNLLKKLCVYTACSLAEQRDPTQVQVVSRDVRVHPKYEGALLVTAQLVNAANFAQPYPLLEFTLFNVNGQTIATRKFTPQEYVGSRVDIGAGMVPSVPTQIELDVLAPEEAAVSFEFRFL